jgi:hypothetical protein
MGKTYKERDMRDLPRVPHWARAKPTKAHGKGRKRPDDPDDLRDEYLEDLASRKDY